MEAVEAMVAAQVGRGTLVCAVAARAVAGMETVGVEAAERGAEVRAEARVVVRAEPR